MCACRKATSWFLRDVSKKIAHWSKYSIVQAPAFFFAKMHSEILCVFGWRGPFARTHGTSYTVNLALPQGCAIDINFMSARPFVHARGTTWLPLERFPLNFILRNGFGGHKICWGNSSLVQKREKMTVTRHDVLRTFTTTLIHGYYCYHGYRRQ